METERYSLPKTQSLTKTSSPSLFTHTVHVPQSAFHAYHHLFKSHTTTTKYSSNSTSSHTIQALLMWMSILPDTHTHKGSFFLKKGKEREREGQTDLNDSLARTHETNMPIKFEGNVTAFEALDRFRRHHRASFLSLLSSLCRQPHPRHRHLFQAIRFDHRCRRCRGWRGRWARSSFRRSEGEQTRFRKGSEGDLIRFGQEHVFRKGGEAAREETIVRKRGGRSKVKRGWAQETGS